MRRLMLVALAATAAAACGGDSTDPLSEPKTVALVSGGAQTAIVGAAFPQPLVVTVTNGRGEPAAGAPVRFEVASGSATVNPSSTNADATGTARTTVTAGVSPGPISITVRSKDAAPATVALTVAPDLAGVYQGTTSQNLPVYIRVNSAGAIDSLAIRLRLSLGSATCTGTWSKYSGITITSAGSFETPFDLVGSSITTKVRGTFANKTVSGSWDAFSGSFSIVCGSYWTIGTGSPLPSGTYTATRP